ncbi:sensor histidine kinase [Anaeromyxobacter terrae]|uniref:sensor histidine kinase n=1 Tax=Anaeromyxobacter terrae TaxID=2925406 RepID=UPI001F57A945|nr:ATP-binding protein [Anaeromyxobacter sp. SG22]
MSGARSLFRRAAGVLRVSRFEAKIAVALVVSATLPLLGALLLAGKLAEENLALGLDPRVVERLEAVPALYGDLFQARKQLYAEQARSLARGLPQDRRRTRAYLESALARTPRLRRVALHAADGAVVAEAETQAENPEGEWREAPARVALPGGGRLDCTFAIEARYFAELGEAREVGELVQGVDALRSEIRRSYVRAFALLLVAWAAGAAAIGILLARRTTRRVTRLVEAVRRLAAGDLAVQVDPGRANDEVAGLARAFNAMVREVRESRDRIVYLEKISGWQDVARRLAHEIKNPLTPMKLAFQQLEARWKATRLRDPDFGKLLGEAGEIVREEIGTLQRLVDEFSAFAKLPEVKPEPAELGAFVKEFLRTSKQLGAAAELSVVKASGSCPVALDRQLMRRVLTNLCQNAIDAARPARARIHLGIARTRQRAVLTVADEGPGIDRDLWDRIFDPYFTTKGVGGTGLGLAIVKKIILQHGGEIQVGDRPGGGASFSIALPLAPEAKSAA